MMIDIIDIIYRTWRISLPWVISRGGGRVDTPLPWLKSCWNA